MTNDASTRPSEERAARLERERQDADRRYNQALTRVDRAIPPVARTPPRPAPYDTTKIPAINDGWNILPDGPPPIDGSLKGRLRGLIWRLVGPMLERQRHFNAALVDHLNRNAPVHIGTQEALAATVASIQEQSEQNAQFHAELVRYLQTVTLYVDSKDRALSSLPVFDDLRSMALIAQRTALSLKRDLENALAGTAVTSTTGTAQPPAAPGDVDAFKYVGFQDAFRGSADDVRRKLEAYAPYFDGVTEVVDIGCGRGEFLELLGRRHVSARGVDSNPAMVEDCRARGLDAVAADALSYLRGLPDESLGGIFSSQVIEHLPPDYLLTLIEVAHHKLRPGGRIVLETINPASWLAFFNSYIRDLTHVRPIHAETLQYFLRVNGFADVTIEYRSPVSETDRLQALPVPTNADEGLASLVGAYNANVAKLNDRMFGDQDYAVVARR